MEQSNLEFYTHTHTHTHTHAYIPILLPKESTTQCNPHQIFNDILQWTRNIHLKIHMETKPTHRQGILHIKTLLRYHSAWPQIISQSHNGAGTKKIYKFEQTEQKQPPRNKPRWQWIPICLQRHPEHILEERQPAPHMRLATLDIHLRENAIRFLPLIYQKSAWNGSKI